MNKLLSANFLRLFKEKVFWLSVITMFIVAVFMMFSGCRQASLMKHLGHEITLDHYYFNLAPAIGLFYAIMIALFLGTDYSDGTIRNKLVVGHTRTHIYLANLVICFVATLFIMVAWLIGGLVGIPFLGSWHMGINGYVLFVLIITFQNMAFTAIFTLISTLSTNKAITIVIAVLLCLVLIIAASMTYNRLNEPEFSNNIIYTSNGMQFGDPTPNPNYISGSIRIFFEMIIDFLPTGQEILMANIEIAHPFRQIIFSTLITFCTVIGGVFAFRRKDLN